MEDTPRRRRRPQEPQQAQEPHRIVLSHESEPDWMVSAGEVSGAASRRSGKEQPPRRETKPDAPAPQRGADSEGAAILAMKKGTAAAQPAQQAPKTAQPASVRTAKKKASGAVKKPARKMTKKQRQRRSRQIRGMAIGIACAALVIALIIGGVVGGSRLLDIKQTLDAGDGVFYNNIFVNGIALGGMTLDQAAATVTAQVSAQIANWKITLQTQDGRSWDITGEDLKMKYDVADQLDQLWAIGHTGSSANRYEQVRALEQNPVMRYTTLSYDMSMINQILTQIKSEVDKPAVSATRINDDTKWPPYDYTDDVPGQQLDISGLNEQISGMVDRLENGVVTLTPTAVQAPVTRAQLEGQIVKLSSFETSITKAGDYALARAENIRIGTEKFNHLVIKSGESVSFNKVAGKRKDPRNGYQPALEIAYGEYVEGLGGGICQVSSTLYNAVVNAGLTVSGRTQHSLPSSYVDMGLDATVSDDRLDFVFKNNTSSDIFLETRYYQKKNGYYHCQFTIYGRPDPNGYTYKLVSEVKETIPIPEAVYRQDTEAKYVIYTDETHQTSKGAEGYVVDVYKVTLDRNGLEVSRDYAYTDTYKATPPVYYVGVTPKETPMPDFYY